MTNTIPLEWSPRAISVDSSNNKVYAALPVLNSISVISGSTNEILANVEVGDTPNALDANGLTNRAYSVNLGSDDVNVIDGFTNSLAPINLIICTASNIASGDSFVMKCTDSPSNNAEVNYSVATP